MSPSLYAASLQVRWPLLVLVTVTSLSVFFLCVGADGSVSDEERASALVLVMVFIGCQVLTAVLLVAAARRRGRRLRVGMAWYYALAAGLAGFGMTVVLARQGVHWVRICLAVAGVLAFAATAVVVLYRWTRLGAARADAATFLGAGHMLVFVGAVASAVVVAHEQLDPIAQPVLVGAVFGVTILGLPTSAGLWLRMSLHSRSVFTPTPVEGRVVIPRPHRATVFLARYVAPVTLMGSLFLGLRSGQSRSRLSAHAAMRSRRKPVPVELFRA